MLRNGLLPNGLFWPNRTVSVEHGIFGNLKTDPNFRKQVGVPMVVIYARFEWFPTPYASCDTSCHLSTIFYRENSRKIQKLSKSKATWHGAITWSYKPLEKHRVISRMSKNNMLWDEALYFMDICISMFVLFFTIVSVQCLYNFLECECYNLWTKFEKAKFFFEILKKWKWKRNKHYRQKRERNSGKSLFYYSKLVGNEGNMP